MWPRIRDHATRGFRWRSRARALYQAQLILLALTYLIATVVSLSIPPAGMHSAADNRLLIADKRYQKHRSAELVSTWDHFLASLAVLLLIAVYPCGSSRPASLKPVQPAARAGRVPVILG